MPRSGLDKNIIFEKVSNSRLEFPDIFDTLLLLLNCYTYVYDHCIVYREKIPVCERVFLLLKSSAISVSIVLI